MRDAPLLMTFVRSIILLTSPIKLEYKSKRLAKLGYDWKGEINLSPAILIKAGQNLPLGFGGKCVRPLGYKQITITKRKAERGLG